MTCQRHCSRVYLTAMSTMKPLYTWTLMSTHTPWSSH